MIVIRQSSIPTFTLNIKIDHISTLARLMVTALGRLHRVKSSKCGDYKSCESGDMIMWSHEVT